MEDTDEIRAFIAMEINDPAIVKGARGLQSRFADEAMGKLKFVELENMHVTLKFLDRKSVV